MGNKLSPISELIVDLDIMEREAEKLDTGASKALNIFASQFKDHIMKNGFLEKERYEIEKAVNAGLSGLPRSGSDFYEKRFINPKDVSKQNSNEQKKT